MPTFKINGTTIGSNTAITIKNKSFTFSWSGLDSSTNYGVNFYLEPSDGTISASNRNNKSLIYFYTNSEYASDMSWANPVIIGTSGSTVVTCSLESFTLDITYSTPFEYNSYSAIITNKTTTLSKPGKPTMSQNGTQATFTWSAAVGSGGSGNVVYALMTSDEGDYDATLASNLTSTSATITLPDYTLGERSVFWIRATYSGLRQDSDTLWVTPSDPRPSIKTQPGIITQWQEGTSIEIAWSKAVTQNIDDSKVYYQYFVGPTSTYSDSYHIGTTQTLTATINQTNVFAKCGKNYYDRYYDGTLYLYVRAYYVNDSGTSTGWTTPTAVAFTYHKPEWSWERNVYITADNYGQLIVSWDPVVWTYGSEATKYTLRCEYSGMGEEDGYSKMDISDTHDTLNAANLESNAYNKNLSIYVWAYSDSMEEVSLTVHGKITLSGSKHYSIRWYDGSKWENSLIYYYDGSDWIESVAYYFDSNEWQPCSFEGYQELHFDDGSDELDMVYPVGAIFISGLDINPSTFFGGTWQLQRKTVSTKGWNNYATTNSTYINSSKSYTEQHWRIVDNVLYATIGAAQSATINTTSETNIATIPIKNGIKTGTDNRVWCGAVGGGGSTAGFLMSQTDTALNVNIKPHTSSSFYSAPWFSGHFAIPLYDGFTITDSSIETITRYEWIRTE